MKICYINDQIFPNDETDGEQIVQTVSTLAANGADITFLLPRALGKGGVTREELKERYNLDLNCRVQTIRGLFPTCRLLEKVGHAVLATVSNGIGDAQVVYTRNIPTVLTALMLTRRQVLYETYRNWPAQIPALAPLFRFIFRRRRFLGAVLHSRFAADSYLKAGAPDEKVYARHNGYARELLLPVLTKEQARKSLGLPMDRQIVTYSGNVSVKKGIMTILDMAQAMPEVLFLLVGSKNPGDVERRAQSMENVQIKGWRAYKETLPFLYASDVLVIPPTLGPLTKVGNTVLPIKTFIYMGTGKAIFAPSSPDLQEILRHKHNAYLVPPDDGQSAIAGMKELLGDRQLMDVIAERAGQEGLDLTFINRSRDILQFIEDRMDSDLHK